MILIAADAADLAAEEIATKYRHRKIPVRGFFIPLGFAKSEILLGFLVRAIAIDK